MGVANTCQKRPEHVDDKPANKKPEKCVFKNNLILSMRLYTANEDKHTILDFEEIKFAYSPKGLE